MTTNPREMTPQGRKEKKTNDNSPNSGLSAYFVFGNSLSEIKTDVVREVSLVSSLVTSSRTSLTPSGVYVVPHRHPKKKILYDLT